MRLRLSEKDATRLGCEQILPFDTSEVSVGDVEELAERFGFDPYDWPTPFLGEISLENAGEGAQPIPPKWQRRAVVCLALRQAGHEVTWEQAGTVKVTGVAYLADEPGKDDTSQESEPSTTTPSTNSGD